LVPEALEPTITTFVPLRLDRFAKPSFVGIAPVAAGIVITKNSTARHHRQLFQDGRLCAASARFLDGGKFAENG